MVQDILNSSSVERLKGLLQSRYGKGLEVSFLNDSGVIELTGGAFSLKEGTLQIPILSHGQLLAMAKVPDAEALSESAHAAISEIVRLILEPAIYNWHLEQSQENAESEKVFVAGLHPVEENPIVETSRQETGEETEKSPIVLIVSKNPHRIPRVALIAHETMERWAFVQWSDIRAQIKSVQDLKELGAMTLLVEDVFLLSDFEKEILSNWARTSNAQTEPALILGSSLKWEELRNENLLPVELLHEAAFHQIEADRLPADRRLAEEAIQLLLDKEASVRNH